ncbi:MAG: fatty acid desaturase [Rhizobiaceae bacterium]|nr:fatty acid desaturase [Rhizobiaceae bacterium]MCV0406175.1 fatty acid desaturase [Rhizobiaceae bacterium]
MASDHQTLDHRALIASLTAAERARLTERTDRHGLIRLASHFGAIILLAALIAAGALGWAVLVLPLGILLVFLFTLLHETVHETPFRSAWINRWVARVCAFVLFLPPQWFRFFHLAHHRHTQDPERDPELASPKPDTLWRYVVHVSGLPIWRSQLTTLFANAFGRAEYEYVPASVRPRLVREAGLMLALYVLLAVGSLIAGSTLLVWIWLLPLPVGQPFLRLYLLAEHGRCPPVANMLENTRTTFTNGLVRWIAWNMPYHAEHHSYPLVPFHKLPDFHRLTRDRLRTTERGYARFNRRYLAEMGRGSKPVTDRPGA